MDRKLSALCSHLTEVVDEDLIGEILVVGCGDGREAAFLAEFFSATVVGIDIEDGFDPLAGKQADLVVVDLDKPHLQPFYGSYPALVFYAKASDVATVVVQGRVVVEKGRLTQHDEEAALAAVKARIPQWVEQIEALDLPANEALEGPCHGAC